MTIMTTTENTKWLSDAELEERANHLVIGLHRSKAAIAEAEHIICKARKESDFEKKGKMIEFVDSVIADFRQLDREYRLLKRYCQERYQERYRREAD